MPLQITDIKKYTELCSYIYICLDFEQSIKINDLFLEKYIECFKVVLSYFYLEKERQYFTSITYPGTNKTKVIFSTLDFDYFNINRIPNTINL